MPQMFLRIHCFERFMFLRPNRGYIEQDLRFEFALLRLVRFEEKNRWRTDHRSPWLMPVRLSHNPSFLRYMRHEGMIKIVRVLERVRQNELRANFPIERCQFIENRVWNSHRIVANVEES